MPGWAVIREARAAAGLTQRALAERAGIAQSEIARVESGRQEPSYARVEQLVRAAGFDLRVELAPYDAHDELLIERMLSLSPEERLSSLEEQTEFFSTAREV